MKISPLLGQGMFFGLPALSPALVTSISFVVPFRKRVVTPVNSSSVAAYVSRLVSFFGGFSSLPIIYFPVAVLYLPVPPHLALRPRTNSTVSGGEWPRRPNEADPPTHTPSFVCIGPLISSPVANWINEQPEVLG